MSYLCPLCQQPLFLKERTYKCTNNHQFDVAKEGYVNLLPVQHKRSKDPGDNKEMMQARRQFLNGGHYQPMRDAVCDLLTGLLAEHTMVEGKSQTYSQLLDIGCGEGYYTSHFANALSHTEAQSGTKVVGLDISKVMIRHAAKRYPECDFLVASSQRLPFADAQLSAVVRIYAPCNGEELQRTIKDNGVVVTVTPGPRHLYQLKEGIYDGVKLHDVPVEDLPGFELEAEHSVAYPMTLNSEDATTLLQMTPFAWRAPEALWQTLKETEQFACEADFTLRVYRKKA
ncbi:23S rRNA (guanine(745)-N(1))-methyltransferase [Enterovibrio norvegicus FF-33]|uniref:23S rRNA (guanine(745)-N(1))-methyltransferase n=1 Tax=Enterovibrio norvegicus TaxID=188144 RepID=UPI0002D4AFC8|nr:23S rRNA (guanine(745)-N(1))-methyltransferase [Enterovibrio norvegicus]OEE70016.1 23S rRNA (guanine(745)-N(1))-methyltransferase [Enterovibrio norvegicus FF-33]